MSWWGLVLSLAGQLGLAFVGSMGLIFALGGLVQNHPFSPGEDRFLSACIIVIPTLSLISAVLLVSGFFLDRGPWTYAAHLLPLLPALAVLGVMIRIARRVS